MKQGKYLIVYNGKYFLEYGEADEKALTTWAKKQGLKEVPKEATVECVAEPRMTREERLAAAAEAEQKKKGAAKSPGSSDGKGGEK